MQYFERNWFLFCVVKRKTVWRPIYCVASSGDQDIVPLLLKHDLTCRMNIDIIFFQFLVPHWLYFFLSDVWMLTSLVSLFFISFIASSLFHVFLFLIASHHFYSWWIRDYLCIIYFCMLYSYLFFSSFHSLFFNIIAHQYFFFINVT